MPHANRFLHVLHLVPLILLLVPRSTHGAEPDSAVVMPVRARAALVVRPARVAAQPLVSQLLLLPRALQPFRVPPALGERAERITVLQLESVIGWQTMGVTRGVSDLGDEFGRLRGEPAGFAGGREVYRLGSDGSGDRITRLGPAEIAEGTAEALRTGLGVQPAAAGRRLEVERALRGLPDPGSPAHVVYIAPDGGADLVQTVTEAGAIWNLDLRSLLEPYEAALRMLGTLHGARADLWQDGEALRVRAALVAPNGAAAQRSYLALRAARQLAPLASDAAVKGGSMTRAEATLLTGVLESMQSRVEGDQVHIEVLLPPEASPSGP